MYQKCKMRSWEDHTSHNSMTQYTALGIPRYSCNFYGTTCHKNRSRLLEFSFWQDPHGYLGALGPGFGSGAHEFASNITARYKSTSLPGFNLNLHISFSMYIVAEAISILKVWFVDNLKKIDSSLYIRAVRYIFVSIRSYLWMEF